MGVNMEIFDIDVDDQYCIVAFGTANVDSYAYYLPSAYIPGDNEINYYKLDNDSNLYVEISDNDGNMISYAHELLKDYEELGRRKSNLEATAEELRILNRRLYRAIELLCSYTPTQMAEEFGVEPNSEGKYVIEIDSLEEIESTKDLEW